MNDRDAVRPVRQLPEVSRLWISFAPASWRFAARPWTDLARGRLSGLRPPSQGELPSFDATGMDDIFYIPPVAKKMAKGRDVLARQLLEAGVPTLIQLAPGEKSKVSESRLVFDLAPPIFSGDLTPLVRLPQGSTAIWPLIPGLSDGRDICDEACELMAAAGVRSVLAVVVELRAADRRYLAEGRDDSVFDALFHGKPVDELYLVRAAYEHGLEPFPARPETGRKERVRQNRQIAARLSIAADLWLRLEKPMTFGQKLLRAARGAEHSRHDVTALGRENNLRIMDWLDSESMELVKEIVDTDRLQLVDDLIAEYVGPV